MTAARRWPGAAAALACALGASACAPAAPGRLEAGVATVPLELPVGVSLGGYGRQRLPSDPGSSWAKDFPASRGVQTAPTARALALASGAARVVLVRVELCLVTERLRARARGILAASGEGAALLLVATHTHSAPARYFPPALTAGASALDVPARAMDAFDLEVEDRLAARIAEAARQALASLRPVAVGVGQVEAPQLNADRRCQNDDLYGPDHRDRRLTVVRLDALGEGGALQPLAAVLHYAVHGTVLPATDTLISTDLPGAIELAGSDALGIPLLFLQGAAGDVGPAQSALGHGAFQQLERLAGLAVPSIARAFELAAPAAPGEAALAYSERVVPLSRAALGYARGEFPEHGGIGCLLGILECRQYTPPAQAICVPMDRGSFPRTTLAALRVGPALLLALPGEPTTSLGARAALAADGARAPWASGASTVLVAGYAQDHVGYLLEQEDFLRGGYEPTVSPWGWRAGDHLLEQLGALLSSPASAPAPLALPGLEAAAPRQATDSTSSPTVASFPGQLERTATAAFAFHGGDPALGTPRVWLEREGAGGFARVMASRSRPVEGGPELVLRYGATPSFAAEPAAPARAHRWTAEWETLPSTPAGRYRLVAQGRARVAGAVEDYWLATPAFEVLASREAGATARAALGAGGRLEVRFRFPANPTLWSEAGEPLGNFRLRDADARPDEGALARGGAAAATVGFAGGRSARVTLTWDDAAGAHVAELGDLQGPRSVSVAAAAFQDGLGNTNGRALSLEVQP